MAPPAAVPKVALHHQPGAYDTDTLIGALDQLRRALGGHKAGQTLDVRPAERARLDQVAAIVAQVTGAIPTSGGDGGAVSVPVDGRLTGTRVLAEVAHRLDAAGIPVTEAGLRLASLDEVFLTLTGHRGDEPKEDR
jgi:oleandomycin transport system ATP-binding protein